MEHDIDTGVDDLHTRHGCRSIAFDVGADLSFSLARFGDIAEVLLCTDDRGVLRRVNRFVDSTVGGTAGAGVVRIEAVICRQSIKINQ